MVESERAQSERERAAAELSAAQAEYREVMSRDNATEGQEGRAEYRLRQAEKAMG